MSKDVKEVAQLKPDEQPATDNEFVRENYLENTEMYLQSEQPKLTMHELAAYRWIVATVT